MGRERPGVGMEKKKKKERKFFFGGVHFQLVGGYSWKHA